MELSQVTAKLTEITHIPFRVPSSVPPYRLIIRAQDAPLSDLLKAIGQATGTDFGMSQGTMYVSKSAKLREAAVRFQEGQKLAIFRRWMADQLKTIKDAPLTPEGVAALNEELRNPREGDNAESMKSYMKMPQSALPAELLTCVNDASLVRANKFHRLVFSTQPSKLQEPMDPRAFDLFQKYREAFVAMLSENLGQGDPSPEQLQWIRQEEIKLRTAKVSRIELVIMDRRFALNAEARLYDATGNIIPVGFNGCYIPLLDDKPDKEAPAPDDVTITASAEEKEFIEALMKRFEAGSGEVPQKLLDRLAHPDQYEPLSGSGSDIFLKLWEKRKVQGVAAVPDHLLYHLLSGLREPTTARLIQKSMESMGVTSELPFATPGWSVIGLTDFETADQVTCTRAESAARIRAWSSVPDIGTEVMELVNDNQETYLYEYPSTIYGILRTSLNQWNGNNTPRSMTKLLRAMTDSQKTSLIAGQTLFTEALQPPAQAELERLAYSSESCYAYIPTWLARSNVPTPDPDGEVRNPPDSERLAGIFEAPNQGVRYYLEEPTSGLPNGLLKGVVSATTALDIKVEVTEKGKPNEPLYFGSLSELGNATYYNTRPSTADEPSAGDWNGKSLLYTVIQRKVLNIRVMYGRDRGLFGTADAAKQERSKPMTLAELPAPFRAEIERGLREAKEAESLPMPSDSATKEGAPPASQGSAR